MEKELTSFLKKNRFKSRIVSAEDLEDAQLAAWIDEGMKKRRCVFRKDLWVIGRKFIIEKESMLNESDKWFSA